MALSSGGKDAHAAKGRAAAAALRAERRARERSAAQAATRTSPSLLYPVAQRAMFAALSPEKRMHALALIEGRTQVQDTFRQYVDRVHPGYIWAPHLVALALVLQDVADGIRTRVMCFMPPRHGKSEQISRLFSAYFLYRHPGLQVALTTYGAELSYELSRDARNNFVAGGGQLADDASAVKTWRTTHGGNLWATGVGGPATGRGFHLGIVDDPYKDATEAGSQIVRKSRLAWYRSVFRTRAAPGAAIVILLTRWHQADLVGELLREEEVTKQGWHVLEMAAEKIIERVDTSTGLTINRATKWPSTVTLSEDARDHPVWLWAARFTALEYENMKRSMGGSGGYFWSALFQQRPVAAEGGLFREEWIKRIPRSLLPRNIIGRVRRWDLAATENGGAYTAGLEVWKAFVEGQYNYYIVNLAHGQWGAGRRDVIIEQTAVADGKDVVQAFPLDPAAAGKQVASQFVRILDGISPVLLMPETGDKALRAQMPASAAANGRLFIVDEPWAEIVVQELAAAGEGAEFWDIVDALSGAFGYLGPIAEGGNRSGARSWSLRTNR